jgi:type VI secretion system secreted protein Hcp
MSASDIHLKIDGIKGESTHTQQGDEIVVDSRTWGIAAGQPAAGGGRTGGRVAFSDLSFTHRADRASALPLRACATSEHIKELLSIARSAPTAHSIQRSSSAMTSGPTR